MRLSEYKQAVLLHIDEFKKYNDAHKGGGAALIAELKDSVNDYFSIKIPGAKIDKLAWAMFFEYNARFKVYENDSEFDFGFDTKSPNGYNDLTLLFNITCKEILNTSAKEFYDAFVFPPKPPKSTESQIVLNPFVTKWQENLETEKKGIIPNIDQIIAFCEKNSQSGGNISLWEDRGDPVKTIETPEIANIVFIKRKVKEVINVYAKDAYLPTYLR